MALKQIIKKEISDPEIIRLEADILGPGITEIIDDAFEIKLAPKNLGPTDYSGFSFKGDYESKEIKGYGSFEEYLDIKEIPAEIKITDEEIAW